MHQPLYPHRAVFFCRGFLGSLVVLPILETFLLGAHQASKTGYNLNVFIFCTQSATCDRICALFSTLTANLSLFTAFLRVKASSLRSLLRLFQLILIDVSRETRIFLAIFSIDRAVHYSTQTWSATRVLLCFCKICSQIGLGFDRLLRLMIS